MLSVPDIIGSSLTRVWVLNHKNSHVLPKNTQVADAVFNLCAATGNVKLDEVFNKIVSAIDVGHKNMDSLWRDYIIATRQGERLTLSTNLASLITPTAVGCMYFSVEPITDFSEPGWIHTTSTAELLLREFAAYADSGIGKQFNQYDSFTHDVAAIVNKAMVGCYCTYAKPAPGDLSLRIYPHYESDVAIEIYLSLPILSKDLLGLIDNLPRW